MKGIGENMKYWDVYMVVDEEAEGEEGYSIFVEADDEDAAVQKIKDEELYEDEEDLKNIKAITEISKEDYEATQQPTGEPTTPL